MIFSSGAVYEGQWQFDKMTGYGTLKLPDGTIQEGTWKDGSLHGCAVFTWPHGVAEYREYDASRGWFVLLFGFYNFSLQEATAKLVAQTALLCYRNLVVLI